MNVMAKTSPVGSNGVIFLPCMQGAMTPTWNGNARGTFTGLTLNTRFEDLTRAVFEGISFGLRDNVDRFEEIGMDCSNAVSYTHLYFSLAQRSIADSTCPTRILSLAAPCSISNASQPTNALSAR